MEALTDTKQFVALKIFYTEVQTKQIRVFEIGSEVFFTWQAKEPIQNTLSD